MSERAEIERLAEELADPSLSQGAYQRKLGHLRALVRVARGWIKAWPVPGDEIGGGVVVSRDLVSMTVCIETGPGVLETRRFDERTGVLVEDPKLVSDGEIREMIRSGRIPQATEADLQAQREAAKSYTPGPRQARPVRDWSPVDDQCPQCEAGQAEAIGDAVRCRACHYCWARDTPDPRQARPVRGES